ncbi:unnamed protein product [Meloidogyne enterolobii]|uniref:Uncharacterized protein n=1 Tax=Meloidogyne enterolobii TaxID=390850 RepID=A0ACB0YNL6_MELEN
MYSLPPEVQLDVLKCLNFNQLSSIKQTNFYFNNLINKCQNRLARVKLKKLEIWQAALDESVPLFLHDFGFGWDFVIRIVDKETLYILKLPNIPKNLKELIIIRFWLKQLFECSFERACFKKIVFNPEMIDLLFDNDKTIPLQFHIQEPFISIDNNIIKYIFKFACNYLAVSETLSIYSFENTEKLTNTLFNILKNEGKIFPKIRFFGLRTTRLHDLFVDVS